MSLEPAPSRPAGRPGAWVWAASLLAVLAVHAAVAVNASYPIWLRDEAMPLLAAGHFAGEKPGATFFSSLPYDTGWSLLLVPLWWVTQDTLVLYRLAIGVAVLCAVASVLPLAFLARRLGARPRLAVVLAALVAALPSRVFESNYTTTENALFLATSCFAASVAAVEERPSARRVALLALSCAALPLVHQRSLPLVAVAVVWLLTWRGERRRRGWVGALAVVAACGVGYLVNRWLIDVVYGSAGGREDALLGTVEQLSPRLLAVSASGQLWYLTVSTLGLVVVGVVVSGRLLVADVRRWRFGTSSVLVVALAGIFLVSCVWVVGGILNDQRRLDVYFYGRLVDPMATVLTLVGLVHLVGRRERASRRALVVSALASLLVVWGWTYVVRPRSAADRQQILPLNTPGVLPYSWPAFGATAAPYTVIVAVTTLGVLALTAGGLLRRHRAWLAAGLAALSVVASVRTEAQVTDVFNRPGLQACSYGDALVSRLQSLGFSTAAQVPPDDSTYAGILLCLDHLKVVQLANELDVTRYAYVIAPNEWPTGVSLGARRIAESTVYNQAIFAMPGPTQDRLAAQGLLEPRDDGWVDDAAARFAMSVEGSVPSPVGTSTARPEVLDVEVRHAGAGEMWRAGTPSFGAGAVYVSQQWSCAGTVAEGIRSNLPRTVMPGETVPVGVALLPPDSVRPGSTCSVAVAVAGVDKVGSSKPFTGTPVTVKVTVR